MSSVDGAPCKLTVCRGCCCGTEKKVPGVDHEAQLARLSAIDDHTARRIPVRTSKCLGICFQANVVVVQPSSQGRAAGGQPVWLGEMTEDGLLEAVDDWIFEGGPGLAPLPAALEEHVTSKAAKKPKKPDKPKHSKTAKKAKKEREKAERAEREKERARPEEKRPKVRDDQSSKRAEKARKAEKKARKALKKVQKG